MTAWKIVLLYYKYEIPRVVVIGQVLKCENSPLARGWRGCTLNEGLCESWQRNAMRSWTRVQTRRSRVSLAAISRTTGKVRKLRKKASPRFPTALAAPLQTRSKRRERNTNTQWGGRPREQRMTGDECPSRKEGVTHTRTRVCHGCHNLT